MAIQNIPKKRGGKQTILTVGIDNGNCECFDEDAFPGQQFPEHEDGQKWRMFPLKIEITFDEGTARGSNPKIKTFWKAVMISNSGKPIHNEARYFDMTTDDPDTADFLNQLGSPILASVVNGKIRKIDGFNDKKLFNGHLGNILTYTPEQEEELPIFSGEGSYGYEAPPVIEEIDESPVNPE